MFTFVTHCTFSEYFNFVRIFVTHSVHSCITHAYVTDIIYLVCYD
jgi:hypothetical protein